MKIGFQEQRNKELAGMQFSKARKKIRQVKAGNKAATQYYKNMQQMDAIPPQFSGQEKARKSKGNAIMNNAEVLVEIEKLLDRKLDEKLDKKLDGKRCKIQRRAWTNPTGYSGVENSSTSY